MKVPCACATAAALVVAMFAGAAAGSAPCWKAAIDDWYADSRFDSAWGCECLREAIDQLPVDGRPSVRDDFRRQLELRKCVGAPEVAIVTATPDQPGGTDKSSTVSDDFPWEITIVGGLSLGLAALIGLAVLRRWRQGS